MKTQPLESTSKDNTSESHESGELIIPSSANVNVERSTAESKPFEPSDTYISQNRKKLSESNFGKLKSSQNNVANVLFQDRKSNDPHFESVTNTSGLRVMGSSSSSDSREEGLITYLRTAQERQTKRSEKENESETKMDESNRKGLKSNEFCLDRWSDSTKDSSFGIPGSNGGAISDSMASSSDKVGSSRSRPVVPDSPLSWSSRDWDRESSRQHRSYDRIRDHHRDRDNTKRDPYDNNRRMHSTRDRRSEYDAEYDRDRGRRDRDRDKGKDRRDRETSKDNGRSRARDRDRDASRDRDIDADLRKKREKERGRGDDPKTAGKQVCESKPENSSVSEEGVHREFGQSISGVGTTVHSSTAMVTATLTHSNVTRNTCGLPMASMGTTASRSPRQRYGQRSRRYRHDGSSSPPSSPSTRSPPSPPSPPSPRSPRSSQPRSPSPRRRRSRRSVSRDRRPRSRSTSLSFRRSPRRLDSDPLGKSRVSSHSAFHSRWKPLSDGLNNHKSESQGLALTTLQVSTKTDGLVRASSLISAVTHVPDDSTWNWNKEMKADNAREGKEGKEENGGGEGKVKECEGVGEQSTEEDRGMKGVALSNPEEEKGRGDVEGRRDKEGEREGEEEEREEMVKSTSSRVEAMSSSSSGSDMEIDDVSSSGTRNSGGGENKNAQSTVVEYPQDSDHYHLHHHYPHHYPHPQPHHHHHSHHPHHHHHHHQQGQSHQAQIPNLVPTSSSTLSLPCHFPPTSQPPLPPPLSSAGKATNRKGWGERKDLSEVNDALRTMATRTTTITATTTSTTEAVTSLPLPPTHALPDALSAAPNIPRIQIHTQKGLSSSSLPVHQPISLSSLSLMIQLPSSSLPSSSSASPLSSLAHPITTPTAAPSYTIPNPSSQPTLGQLSLTAGLWGSNIATSSLSSLPLSLSPSSGTSSTPSLSSALPTPTLSSTLPVSFPPFSLVPATIPPLRFSRGFGKTQRLKTQTPSTGGAIVAATSMTPPPLLSETNGPDASTTKPPSLPPSSPLFEPSLQFASSPLFKAEEQVLGEQSVLTTVKENSKEGVVIKREEGQEDGRLPCLIDSPPFSVPPQGCSHASTKAEGEWRSIKPFEERCDDLSGLVAVEMLQISSMMRAATCAPSPGDEASIHMKRDHLMKEARDFKHQADRERTATAENGSLGRVLGAWSLRTLVLYLRSCLRFFECAHQCELEATSESARRAARLLHDTCGMLSRVQDGARDLRLSLHRLTGGNSGGGYSGGGSSGGGNGKSGSMVKGSCSEDQGMRQNLALSLVMTLAMKLQALARTRWLLLNEAQLNEAIRRIEISLKQHQQDKGLGARRSKGDSGNGGEEEAEGKGISNLSRTSVNGASNNGSNAGVANPMTASAITTSKNTASPSPISIMNLNNNVPIFNNIITSSLSNEDENILLTGSQVTAAQIAAESIEHFARASELWREVSLEETALASTAAAAGEKDALIAAAQVAAMGFEGGAWSLTGSIRIAERVMEVVVERLAVKEA